MKRPNIVYILADDLGYGDLGCYNPNCKVPTPAVDRMAREGVKFTDFHTSSSVCTPTRYSILTGRYDWRSRLKKGVLTGESPYLLETDRPTVASYLRNRGYRTACVGKWHLGLGWRTLDGTPFTLDSLDWKGESHSRIDFSAPLTESPLTAGFDESFIIPSSLDIPPYVYVEGDRAAGIPTEIGDLGVDTPYLMRRGLALPGLRAQDVLPAFTARAVRIIEEHPILWPKTPLFLYFALSAPHTPIVPSAPHRGTNAVGPYGDFIAQIDATVAVLWEALERAGMADDTLLVFTSDNGASPACKLDELRSLGHDPCGGLRGTKADLFEGGHRVPFLVRWPAGAAAGKTCGRTLCSTDLFATAMALQGDDRIERGPEDSVSFLPLLTGRAEDDAEIRETTVHHSISGHFAIRKRNWKLLEARGSGGWSFPKEEEALAWDLPEQQLYNLTQDPGEHVNLAAAYPHIVAELKADLDACRARPQPPPHRR